jgi:hypothetical protein
MGRRDREWAAEPAQGRTLEELPDAALPGPLIGRPSRRRDETRNSECGGPQEPREEDEGDLVGDAPRPVEVVDLEWRRIVVMYTGAVVIGCCQSPILVSLVLILSGDVVDRDGSAWLGATAPATARPVAEERLDGYGRETGVPGGSRWRSLVGWRQVDGGAS